MVVVVFSYLAWTRRWIADDGLIYVRITREILDGNGPVFSPLERAEANTSAIWPWLLALLGWISRLDIDVLAVMTGLVLSIAGVAIAADGTRRWYRRQGVEAPLAPAAVFVILGTFPFWDYATSGLETGLVMAWLAGVWWLLVTYPDGRLLVRAAVLGLGPLVRPDLAVVSIVALPALWWCTRPTRRQTILMILAAGALPIAYEIFRAGYYGVLVPLPALAKSATGSAWGRGFAYLNDFQRPYRLWLPLGVVAALLIARRRSVRDAERVVLATPIVAGALLTIYVLRVGGDFMHARMLLPATFLVLLPGFLLPVTRWTAGPLVAIAVWAMVVGHVFNDHKRHVTSPYVEDERVGFVGWTQDRHPIRGELFYKADYGSAVLVEQALAARRPSVITEGGVVEPMPPSHGERIAFLAGRLGTSGVITPLDGNVVDTLGLSNPVGARITVTYPDEKPGHQKSLPLAWAFADFGAPGFDDQEPLGTPAVQIRAARNALQCGELAELIASVREPMTLGRFWHNLTGSIARTRLVIPADPIDAEWKFCGAKARTPKVRVSSSYDGTGWTPYDVVDGVRESRGATLGYSSELWHQESHVEWIELELPAPRPVRGITLYPRSDAPGAGYPVDFEIQGWTPAGWVTRVTVKDAPQPDGPRTYTWPAQAETKVRLHATALRRVDDTGYQLQLAEIELL